MATNDNEPEDQEAAPISPEASGKAALLLVESLIHGLCENAVLNNDQAVEIVERAVDVQSEQAEAADGAGATMWQSRELLAAIAASLRTDGDQGHIPPHLVS